MNDLNKFTVKAILDSKKYDFDFSKYSRKQLEFILLITISEYRHIKGLYDIISNFDNKRKE